MTLMVCTDVSSHGTMSRSRRPSVRREEKCIQNCGGETWRTETTWILGIDGRTILTRILVKYDGKVQTGFIWLRIEFLGRCEHGNEPWGFIYCKDCFNYPRNTSFASRPVLRAVNWLLCLCVWYDSHKQTLISSLDSINTLVGSLNVFWKCNFTVRQLVYITEIKSYAGSKLTHCGANHVRQVSRKLPDK